MHCALCRADNGFSLSNIQVILQKILVNVSHYLFCSLVSDFEELSEVRLDLALINNVIYALSSRMSLTTTAIEIQSFVYIYIYCI